MDDNTLLDRYYEIMREIYSTPPVYFLKINRLLAEYELIKVEMQKRGLNSLSSSNGGGEL